MSKRKVSSKSLDEASPPEPRSYSRQVIIVLPKTESEDQQRLRKKVEWAISQHNLELLKTIRVEEHRVTGGEEKDRLFPILSTNDAVWIYRSCHRYAIAILSLTAAYIRRDPSQYPKRFRSLISIDKFVRYKAYFGHIRTMSAVEWHVQNFIESLDTVECDGPDDPRALPFHIFNCPNEWDLLEGSEQQERFAFEHGRSSQRRDCDKVLWNKPKGQAAKHGGGPLLVGKTLFEQGFHWDVVPEGLGTILTPDSVWHLEGANAYLNVYPDGFVRISGRSSGVKRVWPRK